MRQFLYIPKATSTPPRAGTTGISNVSLCVSVPFCWSQPGWHRGFASEPPCTHHMPSSASGLGSSSANWKRFAASLASHPSGFQWFHAKGFPGVSLAPKPAFCFSLPWRVQVRLLRLPMPHSNAVLLGIVENQDMVTAKLREHHMEW